MTSKAILFLLLVCIAIQGFSQQFQGRAIYESKHEFDFKIDSSKTSEAIVGKVKEQFKDEFQKKFTLQFNQKESSYTENERLGAPILSSGIISSTTSNNREILYKNTVEKTYLKQQELMGKLFLIKDSLELPDWKLINDSKQIGSYTTQKAVWTREVKNREFTQDGVKETTIEKTTIVWYTPQIPINSGPDKYWGLPGLILEVQEDGFTLLCSEITLNPQERFEIQIPSKGEEVDQETFDKIEMEKTLEMMERYSSGRKNGRKIISIKTGG